MLSYIVCSYILLLNQTTSWYKSKWLLPHLNRYFWSRRTNWWSNMAVSSRWFWECIQICQRCLCWEELFSYWSV